MQALEPHTWAGGATSCLRMKVMKDMKGAAPKATKAPKAMKAEAPKTLKAMKHTNSMATIQVND